MSSKQHSVFIRSLFRALCIVVFGISFIHSATFADRDRHAARVNTQAAIDEINDVLRALFPIVPHKSHIILTSRNQKLWIEHPKVVTSSEEFIADSLQKHENIRDYEKEETETRGRLPGPLQAKPNRVTTTRAPPAELLSDLAAALGAHTREPTPHPPPAASPVSTEFEISDSQSPGAFSGVRIPEVVHHHSPGASRLAVGSSRLPLFLRGANGSGLSGKPRARPEPARTPAKLDLSTAALGKRGPECMRRCILQGLLHPVQCHSLC